MRNHMPKQKPADFDDLPDEPQRFETTRVLHDVYLKAVNQPTRRRMLEIVNAGPIEEDALVARMKAEKLVADEKTFKFHLDYLLKANCLLRAADPATKKIILSITQEGRVIEYMDK